MAGVEVGTAFVSIIPSARGFAGRLQGELTGELTRAGRAAGATAGTETARSFTSRLDAGLRGFASRLGSLLRTGFLVAGAAAAGGIAAITGFGLKATAALEQTRIGFVGLLGSAQQADSFLRELQSFAAATPLEFPGVADAARNLLAMGNAAGISRDQIIPTLTVVGNLAATLGQGQPAIDAVIRAFGQMASKGKITTEELLQISEALPGFNAVAAIAAAKGITVAQAQELISRGAISAQEGIAALLAGMRQFPGAADAMKRQSETLLGVFSTFKDTIALALTGAFTPVIPAIKDALTGLTPVLQGAFQTLGPAIGQALTAVLPLLGALVQALTPILTPLLQGIGQLAAALTPALAPLGQALGLIAQALTPLFPVIGQLAALLAGNLAKAATALAPILAAVAKVLAGAIGPVIPKLAAAFDKLATALTPIAAQLADLLAGALQAILPPILELLPALAAGLTPALVALAGAYVQLLPALLPLIPPLGQLLLALAPIIALAAQLAATILGALIPPLVPLIILVAQLAGWLVGLLAQGIALIVTWIIGPLVGALQAAIVWFGNLLGTIVGAVRTAVAFVVGNFGAIVGFIAGMPGRVNAAARGMFDGIHQAFRAAVNAIIRGWNRLEFRVPGFSAGPVHFSGFTLGIPDIPLLATGAIIKARAGGTLAVLGEGREDEAVLPLSRLEGMLGSAPVPAPPDMVANVFIGDEPIARRVRVEVTDQVDAQARALRRGRINPTGDL